ncbi:hypothetical protein GCM10007897_27660 [Sphingobium jiangsuense]|uniref:Uncharacterized protein n=1 Tax=Sphingobium jiangsuense TaxID=870476 RepID=A0A7W6BM15_9SPHN|nr:hypothetical protein [Sphingobium jiangsuense]MBB3926290.1 hypothetical protein [Sphingobium jiangsuense]GLT01373.1 hypothetical protein GCM10007897_27660 [Sphingobium jiangsuense]
MVTILAGLLFSFGLMMATGTIIGMSLAYRGKAMAALRMEHRPARADTVHIRYSPARRPRFVPRHVSGTATPLTTVRAA